MTKTLFSLVKYLAINEHDKSWGLSITTAGFQSILPHTTYPPKGHPSSYWFNPTYGRKLHEYQIIYITKGEGLFQSTSMKQTRVKAGEIILLFPEEWHTYHPAPQSGWDTYWIGFYGNFPDSLINHHFFTEKNAVQDTGFNEEMVTLYKRAIDLAQQERSGFQQILSGIVIHLLGMIYYITKNNLFEDKGIVAKIEKARMLMREYPDRDICLKEIAASLNMGYSWFRKTFQQYTGLSPAQYRLQIKLQRSKALLVSSSMSVKEIAYQAGFESPNYFISFFKNKTGHTPLEYRKISHGKS